MYMSCTCCFVFVYIFGLIFFLLSSLSFFLSQGSRYGVTEITEEFLTFLSHATEVHIQLYMYMYMYAYIFMN